MPFLNENSMHPDDPRLGAEVSKRRLEQIAEQLNYGSDTDLWRRLREGVPEEVLDEVREERGTGPWPFYDNFRHLEFLPNLRRGEGHNMNASVYNPQKGLLGSQGMQASSVDPRRFADTYGGLFDALWGSQLPAGEDPYDMGEPIGPINERMAGDYSDVPEARILEKFLRDNPGLILTPEDLKEDWPEFHPGPLGGASMNASALGALGNPQLMAQQGNPNIMLASAHSEGAKKMHDRNAMRRYKTFLEQGRRIHARNAPEQDPEALNWADEQATQMASEIARVAQQLRQVNPVLGYEESVGEATRLVRDSVGEEVRMRDIRGLMMPETRDPVINRTMGNFDPTGLEDELTEKTEAAKRRAAAVERGLRKAARGPKTPKEAAPQGLEDVINSLRNMEFREQGFDPYFGHPPPVTEGGFRMPLPGTAGSLRGGDSTTLPANLPQGGIPPVTEADKQRLLTFAMAGGAGGALAGVLGKLGATAGPIAPQALLALTALAADPELQATVLGLLNDDVDPNRTGNQSVRLA